MGIRIENWPLLKLGQALIAGRMKTDIVSLFPRGGERKAQDLCLSIIINERLSHAEGERELGGNKERREFPTTPPPAKVHLGDACAYFKWQARTVAQGAKENENEQKNNPDNSGRRPSHHTRRRA